MSALGQFERPSNERFKKPRREVLASRRAPLSSNRNFVFKRRSPSIVRRGTQRRQPIAVAIGASVTLRPQENLQTALERRRAISSPADFFELRWSCAYPAG